MSARPIKSLKFGDAGSENRAHREHRSKRGRKEYKTWGMQKNTPRNSKKGKQWRASLDM